MTLLGAIFFGLAPHAFGLASHVTRSHTNSLRAQIESAVRQGEQSIAHKDLKAYMSGYADDFQGQDITGAVYGKQQAQQNVAKAMSYAQAVQSQEKVLTVQPTVKGAIVLSQEHTTVHIIGRRTHKIHILIFDGLWQSVWVKSGRKWLVWRETQLSQTITRDGKAQVIKPGVRHA